VALESFGRHPRDFSQIWAMALACISMLRQLYRFVKLRAAVVADGALLSLSRLTKLTTACFCCVPMYLPACLPADSAVISRYARSFPEMLCLPVALHASPALRTDCKPS
jgi:hypothetical protein